MVVQVADVKRKKVADAHLLAGDVVCNLWLTPDPKVEQVV